MRRLSIVAAIAVLAVLPAAAGATSGATKDVSITDTAVDPVEVRIAVGDSVRWRNTGSRTHGVVSDTGAWTPFVLRPRRTKSVRFREAGCYRYKVDGRIRGRVAVAAACGAGGGGGGTTGPTTFRYDVTVTGRAHTVQRITGDTRPSGANNTNGTIDVALNWKSTYRNVALKKTAAGADIFTLLPAGRLFTRGTTDLTFTYHHARQEAWGPCLGDFSMRALASQTSVIGSRGPPLGSTFQFSSQMLNAPAQTVSDRIRSSCPKYSDEPRWIGPGREQRFIVRDGLTWQDVSDPITLVTVVVERKSARLFFPLTRLSQGDGFTIQTGPIRNQTPCIDGGPPFCTETFDGSLVVKFVPRRP